MRRCGAFKVFIVEPRRMPQYRLGDGNLLIRRERADDADRRVRQAGEAARELGARIRLDRRRQTPDQVVEQRDVIFAVTVGARDK